MKISTLIAALNEKFEVARIKEEWSWAFDTLVPKNRIAPSFMHSSVGLLISSGDECAKIYTACFPSHGVLSEIERKGVKDTLLVLKHPFDWHGDQGFVPFSADDLDRMRRFRINLYSLHTPLDKNRNEAGLCSTAYGCAKAIGLRPHQEFGKESDANPSIKVGVLGTVVDQDLSILTRSVSGRLRHEVKVWNFSPGPVRNVGIVTGGGAQRRLLVEAKAHGIDTYLTGVTQATAWPPSRIEVAEFFETAKKLHMNVLGCSHYLTEKWCMEYSMPYFSRLGVPAEFIEDMDALNRLD